MPRIILYEDSSWRNLLPLVYFRTVFQLRCGMQTLYERASSLQEENTDSLSTGSPNSRSRLEFWCRPTLASLLAEQTGRTVNAPGTDSHEQTLLLNGRGFWNDIPDVTERDGSWIGTVGERDAMACIAAEPELMAELSPEVLLDATRTRLLLAGLPRVDVSNCVRLFDWPWQLVNANAAAIRRDWDDFRSCASRQTLPAIPGVYFLNPQQIHLGENSEIKPCAVIDAEAGPIWIDKRVTILPHAYIQGPVYIGPECVIQAGTRLRSGCSLGPVSKVGGELESSILLGYSNKQHDGFLGHSFIGSWCNLGAGCAGSDLKNTYGPVRVPINGRIVESGEMFVGLFMGDFSKAGINVAFPTGSVVGVCSSIFAPRSPKFVLSFSWIDETGVERYDVERAVEIARKVMARRKKSHSRTGEETFHQVRRQVVALEHKAQMDLETPDDRLFWPPA